MYNISHVEFTTNGFKWSYAICDVLAKSESFMTSANASYNLFYVFLSSHKVHFVQGNKCSSVSKSSKNKESYLKTHMPLTLCRDYHRPTNGRQTVIWKQWAWHAIYCSFWWAVFSLSLSAPPILFLLLGFSIGICLQGAVCWKRSNTCIGCYFFILFFESEKRKKKPQTNNRKLIFCESACFDVFSFHTLCTFTLDFESFKGLWLVCIQLSFQAANPWKCVVWSMEPIVRSTHNFSLSFGACFLNSLTLENLLWQMNFSAIMFKMTHNKVR